MSKQENSRIKRAYCIDDFERMKFKDFAWGDEWIALFGDTELAGCWLVWGNSGNGKTSFALQLCKHLANNGVKCIYNSLEQGRSKSLQKQIALTRFENKKNFTVLDREPIAEMKERLRRRRSADVIVIDSIQYTLMKYSDYQALKEEFPNKLFVYISHANGKEPRGATATSVRYDADVKLWIEGYRAFSMSRLGGGTYYNIWPQASAAYYNDDLEPSVNS